MDREGLNLPVCLYEPPRLFNEPSGSRQSANDHHAAQHIVFQEMRPGTKILSWGQPLTMPLSEGTVLYCTGRPHGWGARLAIEHAALAPYNALPVLFLFTHCDRMNAIGYAFRENASS
jgi:hypothetical protein